MRHYANPLELISILPENYLDVFVFVFYLIQKLNGMFSSSPGKVLVSLEREDKLVSPVVTPLFLQFREREREN